MAKAYRPVNEANPYEALERYRDITPGSWDDFMATVRTPQPVTVWRNETRIGHDAFMAWMEEYEGLTARASDWDPRLYRLAPPPSGTELRARRYSGTGPYSGTELRARREAAGGRVKAGNLLAYGAGLYHVQEETAAMPAVVLTSALPPAGPDGTERAEPPRVLDLCAAPGNKSAQLAQMVGPMGTIVANDVNERRLRSGVPTWERLGLTNIAGTVYDGRSFPPLSGVFDAVLVDAPCTGEGTCRRNPGALRPTSDAFQHRLRQTQAALLRRGVELCRPGGRIVYCTCTFAPEENEKQIDALLKSAAGDAVTPEAVRIPGVTGVPGVACWKGENLDTGVQNTLRIWPHQNDTGGFFIAALRKAGPA